MCSRIRWPLSRLKTFLPVMGSLRQIASIGLTACGSPICWNSPSASSSPSIHSWTKAKTPGVEAGRDGHEDAPFATRHGEAAGHRALEVPRVVGAVEQILAVALQQLDLRQPADRQIGDRDAFEQSALYGVSLIEVVHFTSPTSSLRRIGHIDHPARRRAFFKTSRSRGAVTRMVDRTCLRELLSGDEFFDALCGDHVAAP